MTDEEHIQAWRWERQMLQAILALLVAAVTGGVAWMWSIDRSVTTMSQQITSEAARLDQNTAGDLAQDRQLSGLDARLRASETFASEQRAELRAIRDALSRIDGRLNRLLNVVEDDR